MFEKSFTDKILRQLAINIFVAISINDSSFQISDVQILDFCLQGESLGKNF